MEITLNITEDSKVELVKDSCEAVQGENNVTILNINFPSTIKGYSIDNYTRQIEFGECKELGECKKFLDIFEGNTYKLCSTCTQFEKLLIQFTLKNLVDEAEPIVWKTIPFALEFCESINAESAKEVQAALLSLAEIEKEWENYIENNTFRVINRVGDMPTADAAHLGDTIFYLGANSTSPYVLTYGHYYRCNYVSGVYEWTDLTQDPSLEGVANGIREISKNQTVQLWVNSTEEFENEVPQEGVIYLFEDQVTEDAFDEIFNNMAGSEDYSWGLPKYETSGLLKSKGNIVPYFEPIWSGSVTTTDTSYISVVGYADTSRLSNKLLKITYKAGNQIKHVILDTATDSAAYAYDVVNVIPLFGINEYSETAITIDFCRVIFKYEAGELSVRSYTKRVGIGSSLSDSDSNYPITVLRVDEIIDGTGVTTENSGDSGTGDTGGADDSNPSQGDKENNEGELEDIEP